MSPTEMESAGTAVRPAALAAIGSTPIVRLTRLAGPDIAEVWVKLEAANPTGSYKDRMALAMIEGAERDGRLRPGQTVVEYTGGATGSSLAFVCAVKGYPLRIVVVRRLRAREARDDARVRRGARARSPARRGSRRDLIPAMRERAAQVAARDRRRSQTDQFNNHDMVDGYRALGEEILEQLGGRVDAWVSYVGTAGCFCGVSAALRDRLPDVRRVAVEPAESAVLSGRAAGTHRIEGGGIGSVPPLLDVARDIDGVHAVPQDDAFAMARRAAARGGGLLRPVDRREPDRRAGGGARARAQEARRDGRGRLGAEVPRRPALRRLSYSGPRARNSPDDVCSSIAPSRRILRVTSSRRASRSSDADGPRCIDAT